MATFWPFRLLGNQDAEEGGAPFVTLDAGDRTLMSATKLPIRNVAAAYTFVPEDSGTMLFVKAAITFTLPAVSAALKGCHLWIFNATDTDLVIAATANQLKTFNDVGADSLTINTSGEKVGYAAHFVCDGEFWYEMRHADEAQTVTVGI